MKRRKGTYAKLLFRDVRSTIARFLSILSIFAVGVGFLGGLIATMPDMQLTVDNYYDETNMFDLYFKGTMGLTEDDLESVRNLDYVEDVTPAYVTDLTMVNSVGSYVTRIYGLDINDENLVNNFVLTEGRLPQNSSECLICCPNSYTSDYYVGETFTISEDNRDYDELEDTYAFTELTAVGIISLPYYISIEGESSTVGTGSVELVMYVLPEAYTLDVYTDFYLTLEGASEMDSFSDEYTDYVDEYAEKLEAFGLERSQIRYDSIVQEAQSELNSAREEYDSSVVQAESELEEARGELDDGWTELEQARQELADAESQLTNAQNQINSALAQLNSSIASAQSELASSLNAASESQKAAARIQVDESFAEYQNELNSQRSQLEANKELMDEDDYAAASAQLDAAQAELDASKEASYNEACTQIDAAIEAQRAAAQAQIDANRSAGLAQIYQSQAELNQQIEEYNTGLAQLSESEAELQSGETEYAEAQSEAETSLAEALEEIENAQQEIDSLEMPEWYIFDRSDTVGFSSYKSNSEKVDAIARIFPIFLFFVAALVALTTMTRLIEEERLQIGTLKALGYSDGSILGYYIGYSAIACLAGSIAGIFIGFKSLPGIIVNAYSMMFTAPKTEMPFHFGYAVVIISVALVCSVGATLWACLSQLREKPATLMQPQAPKAGKRILLERIGFIWKPMKFTHKVTARNIFRYKKRFFMTVIGIAGCTALLLCSFGLRDSIHGIVDLQFGEIYHYNFMLYTSEPDMAENDPIISEVLETSPYIDGTLSLHYEAGYVESDGTSISVSLVVPRDISALSDFVTLRERVSGNPISFDENSVILTEKLCETLDISVGDTVSIRNVDGKTVPVTVTGICENYVTSYAYIGTDAFFDAFGEAPEYTMVWGMMNDSSSEARDAVSSALLMSDNALSVSFTESIRESFENTVKSIDYIVIVLILAAGTLAVIVLYNLTNINICERKKELATIKVLGFHEGEVISYIYRETNILCLIGIAVGLDLGIWLHRMVVLTAEIDSIMFGRSIYPMSYVYATVVTVVFMLLVELVMLKKLRNIDMVESMKANE